MFVIYCGWMQKCMVLYAYNNEWAGDQPKGTSWHMRPSETQISLPVRAVWSESSMGALWVAKGPTFLRAEVILWSECADVRTSFKPSCTHMSTYTLCWIPAHIIMVNSQALEGNPSMPKVCLFEGIAFQLNNFTMDGFSFQLVFSLKIGRFYHSS